MPTVSSTRRALLSAALLGTVGLRLGPAQAADDPDIYEAALRHSGRPPNDLKRDAIDHPAAVLRAAGIKPGMHVVDLLGAEGYYSEILSYLVGPGGHVWLLNNAAYDHWSTGLPARLAGGRLPNVEHRTIDLEKMDQPSGSADAVLVIKVYHDFYWVPSEGPWPRMDPQKVLAEISRILKPGGVLVVEDHSARPGTGKADATTIHRIEESYAKRDFESHGLRCTSSLDVLRRPDDPLTQITYEGPMVGKTDRFLLLFRKPG